MNNKFSVITGFLGTIKNRFMTYQGDRSLEEKFLLAAGIEDLHGLELCYPGDFADVPHLKALLAQHTLGVSAINFRSRRTGTWWRGSFSSAMASERKEVVEDLKKVMELSEEIGCNLITTCPLNEGSDYLFEIDYRDAYQCFEETIQEAASSNPRVKISLEYKWNDPRARSLLGNAGETLAFCLGTGLSNVGVTLDIGHSMYAGERPSQSAAMLSRADRLFHVHLNDNDKFWDWDMLPGAYNFWDFIEFFFYLRKIGYDGWFAYDIFPKEQNTVETFNVAIRATRKLIEISKRLDEQKIQELLVTRDPAKSLDYLYSIL